MQYISIFSIPSTCRSCCVVLTSCQSAGLGMKNGQIIKLIKNLRNFQSERHRSPPDPLPPSLRQPPLFLLLFLLLHIQTGLPPPQL